MSGPGAIACIGGGGFLVAGNVRGVQERHLLTLVRPSAGPRPARAVPGYLAGGDSERGQLGAYRMFASLGCDITTLPFFPYEMKRDYVAEARAADLIYVGGGNTPAMIAVWRSEFGFDRAHQLPRGEAGTVEAVGHQRRRQLLVRALRDRQRARRRRAPRPGLAARHVLPAPRQRALARAGAGGRAAGARIRRARGRDDDRAPRRRVRVRCRQARRHREPALAG